MNLASKLTILKGFSFTKLNQFYSETLKITQTDQKPTFKQFDDYLYRVCNFQSMKSPLELNSL